MNINFTGFITNPKSEKSKPNWLVIVWDGEDKILAFYMNLAGGLFRSVKNIESEYKFAQSWTHCNEANLTGEILEYAKANYFAYEQIQIPIAPATQNPFANLKQMMGSK